MMFTIITLLHYYYCCYFDFESHAAIKRASERLHGPCQSSTRLDFSFVRLLQNGASCMSYKDFPHCSVIEDSILNP